MFNLVIFRRWLLLVLLLSSYTQHRAGVVVLVIDSPIEPPSTSPLCPSPIPLIVEFVKNQGLPFLLTRNRADHSEVNCRYMGSLLTRVGSYSLTSRS